MPRASPELQLAVGLLAAAAALPVVAVAQGPSGDVEASASVGPPDRIEVATDDACADRRARELLVEALRARLSETTIDVVSTVDRDVPNVSWTRADDTCRLVLRGVETPTADVPRLELSRGATPGEIRNASSRVAWLVSAGTDSSSRRSASPDGDTTAARRDAGLPNDAGSEPRPDNRRDAGLPSDAGSAPRPDNRRDAGGLRDTDAARSVRDTDATKRNPASMDGTEGVDADRPPDRTADTPGRRDAGGTDEGDTVGSRTARNSSDQPPTDPRRPDGDSDSTERDRSESSESSDVESIPPESVGVARPKRPPYTEDADERRPDPRRRGTDVPLRLTLIPKLSLPVGAPRRPVPAFAFNVVGYNYGLRGIEIGLGANIESGFASGIQIAGTSNWVAGPVRGIQLAGALNVADGSMGGIQVSGGANWATREVDGIQLGTINVADDVDGLQTGVVNVGDDVDGLQLGLVNLSARSDTSLGLLNIQWDRPTYLHFWSNGWFLLSTALQNGSDHLYSIYRLGFRPTPGDQLLASGVGLGTRFEFKLIGSVGTYIELDAFYNLLVPVDRPDHNPGHWTQLRFTAAIQLAPRFAFYSGFSANAYRSEPAFGRPNEFAPDIDSASRARGAVLTWPGVFLGIRM